MHIAKWKKPVWKNSILYDSNYMAFYKQQNYRDRKKISDCKKFRRKEGGKNRWCMEEFQGSATTLNDIQGWCRTLYICQKPYSVKHKDWTWINNNVSVLIHHCKKGTTVTQQGIIYRGNRGRLGVKEVHERYLDFLLNFSINPKLLQKIKSFNLKWFKLDMSKIEFNRMFVILSNTCESESDNEVAQSCPTLCDPMDYSLPCSSIHGIFQARVLEWVAISFSRGSSRPS